MFKLVGMQPELEKSNRIVTIQVLLECHTREGGYPGLWIPAFAGLTERPLLYGELL